MHSLRSRLILSHVLPVLIVIPLIGLALYWVLLTQSNLGNVEAALEEETAQLAEQARLLAQATGSVEEIWTDEAFAQSFITGIDLELTTISFYDAAGQLLATDAPGQESLDSLLSREEAASVLSGQQRVRVSVRNPSAQIADAILPVFDVDNRLTGALRLSRDVADVRERFRNLTWVLVGVTGLLLALGVGLGLWLALRLEHSLTQVTTAIFDTSAGRPPATLPSQNIAEINMLYTAVNTLVDRLEGLEVARKRLLANVVHELGRPLGSMRAAIQALQQGAIDDPILRDELLSGVDHQIERMQPLLEELTHLHGQVLGSLELQRQPIEPTSWLQELSSLWREAARQQGLTWRADIPLNLPVVSLDLDQMSRAVGNLLSNAIKFTPPGGEVTLVAGSKVDDQPSAFWIRISDTGPGIDPSDQPHIFEPFRRGEATRRFPQGMGLGLAIARDIVEAHDGQISYVSETDEGTTFTITVPN
jgi:two-component system sensor histidine kinase BaeS